MKNFYTGLMTYFNVANSFKTAIGGRLYNTIAPDNTVMPYCVFTHISATQANTFTENMDEILIQFSIFSDASSPAEVYDAMTALKALFDKCTFTVTSATVVSFDRSIEGLIIEDHETEAGAQRIWHYHVDYYATLRKV